MTSSKTARVNDTFAVILMELSVYFLGSMLLNFSLFTQHSRCTVDFKKRVLWPKTKDSQMVDVRSWSLVQPISKKKKKRIKYGMGKKYL